jgi:hypothetical protein
MDRFRLTREQRHALLREVEARRNWLHRLHIRMRAQQWDETCPTYRTTLNAIDAMTKLMVSLRTDPEESPADWMTHIGR